MNKLVAMTIFASLMTVGCYQVHKEGDLINQQQTDRAIVELRAAYAAFNRGDIDAAVVRSIHRLSGSNPSNFRKGVLITA